MKVFFPFSQKPKPEQPKPIPKPQPESLVPVKDLPTIKTHEPDPVTALSIFLAFVLVLITKG